jgi:sec-independent protein translocase protein TatC
VTEPTPEDKAALDATRAPLMEHLVELRKRLVRAMIAFAICFVICFYFSKAIFAFLIIPLHAATNHLIYTALTEVFFTQVKIGMFGGACLAFPFIAGQLWAFVAPGLYRHERAAFVPFLVLTPIMFAMGAGFVYYVMLPFAIRFFGGYQVPAVGNAMGIELQAKVGDYLDFVMMLMFAFGLTFQLPVLLSLLGKVGIVSVKALKEMRRYAYVGLFAVAAAITPPDPISMLSLAFPLVALYEISVFSVMMIERNRKKDEAARTAASAKAGT